MTLNKLSNYILVFCLSILIFGAGFKYGEYKTKYKILGVTSAGASKNNFSRQRLDFSLFWDVWDKLEKKFVDSKKLDSKKMFYGAVKGMVASLEDPYTFFLTPSENQQNKDELEGKFEGIGAQLGLKNFKIVVIAPLKNSPAAKAGIKSGDTILKVDGASTQNWTLVQAVIKIRGRKGTKVVLTILRGDKELNIEIVRADIIVASVELTFEDEVAHLKLDRFGEDTMVSWDRVIGQIRDKWRSHQIKGMVLDLRDNPGGYLDGSVYTASEFLTTGKTVVSQVYGNSQPSQVYKVTKKGQLLDIPLVVIINEGSASASEILAGALRDNKRAKIVGKKSFGKGSVQEALDLSDHSGLHVTVAKWILPKGSWINAKGIEPDIAVENKQGEGDTLNKKDDLQLIKAVDIIKKGL